MKDILRIKLVEAIKKYGRISYTEMEQLCEDWGYRKSNGERTMRKVIESSPENIAKGIYDPTIHKLRNEKGYIIGYYHGVSDQKISENVQDFLEKWPSREKVEPRKVEVREGMLF